MIPLGKILQGVIFFQVFGPFGNITYSMSSDGNVRMTGKKRYQTNENKLQLSNLTSCHRIALQRHLPIYMLWWLSNLLNHTCLCAYEDFTICDFILLNGDCFCSALLWTFEILLEHGMFWNNTNVHLQDMNDFVCSKSHVHIGTTYILRL